MDFLRSLGVEIIEVGGGLARARLQAGPQHLNPAGAVHGGVLCTLADGVLAHAAWSLQPEALTVVTAELKVNFLAAAYPPLLEATAQVVYQGRTSAVGEVRVSDANHQLVAMALGTMVLPRKRPADVTD